MQDIVLALSSVTLLIKSLKGDQHSGNNISLQRRSDLRAKARNLK